MILASTDRLEVRTIVNIPFTDLSGVPQPPQPFKVVREATKKEYVDFVRGEGVEPELPPVWEGQICPYFYEVETD
jgi:hypothetical protein